MRAASVRQVLSALEAADARYLVVGGLAVVAHGYLRATHDLDLVLDLDADNLARAIASLEALGYRPALPVALHDLADPSSRRRWMDDKDAVVLQLVSDAHPRTPIDVFLSEPFDFAPAWAAAERLELAPGVEASFLALDDLIDMKREAGRPQDLIDIEKLLLLERERRVETAAGEEE